MAYAIAEDNLRVGRTVIADSVNPLQLTRNTWLDVGEARGSQGGGDRNQVLGPKGASAASGGESVRHPRPDDANLGRCRREHASVPCDALLADWMRPVGLEAICGVLVHVSGNPVYGPLSESLVIRPEPTDLTRRPARWELHDHLMRYRLCYYASE